MFVGSYIVILALSTAFLAWVLTFGATRFGPMLPPVLNASHGTFALFSATCFLTVIGAPGPLLLGLFAFIVCDMPRVRESMRIRRWGLPLLAIGFSLVNMHTPALAISAVALLIGAGLFWFGFTFTGRMLHPEFARGIIPVSAALLPIAAASLMGAPDYLSLDSALVLAGLCGAAFTATAYASFGASRNAYAFVIGWLILTAAAYGAYIPAAASLILWFAALTATRQGHSAPVKHAHDF